MIVAQQLTKRFGDNAAVDDVSFEVQPGALVGIVGHDGAGKSTILRMLVGQVTPSSGSATVLGKPFGELVQPLRRVGVMIGSQLHPARTVRDHLRICAAFGGLEARRIDEVLGLVGLEDQAGSRSRRLTAGMRGRLGIAAALLADPEVVILDEPGAGFDLEGLRWLRSLLRSLADDGRTVLVCSQSSDELEEVADQVLVMDRGSLLAESTPSAMTKAQSEVLVRSPGAEVIAEKLRDAGIGPTAVSPDELRVRGVPVRVVSELAAASGMPIWEIRDDEPSLEESVVELRRSASGNGAGPNGTAGGERSDEAPTKEDQAAERGDEAPPGRDDAEDALDRELSDSPELGRPHIVAVLAPADGLGRTTLSFLVADVLAACAGMPTLAVALSCDHERMSLPTASDQHTSLCLPDLLGDLPGFDEVAHISPYVSVAGSGAQVLCGPSQPEDLSAIEPSALDALLDFAERFYSLIVLDIGGLSEPSLRAIVRRADRVLLLGAPGAVDDLDERCAVLDAIEEERDDRATLVFNLVDAQRLQTHGDSRGSHVLVPQDRDLIRALDAGDFVLADVHPVTRAALKRLALASVDGLG